MIYPFEENNLNEAQKESRIEAHFEAILKTLGLDLSNESIKDTPKRMAKMYVREIFKGLDKSNSPKITTVKNFQGARDPIKVMNIELKSYCEHHLVPFIGKCHVAYIPDKKIVGLSKINRIVDFHARRPQIQERLTLMIKEHLISALEASSVIVVIQAEHFCVKIRGIQDSSSYTETVSASGIFEEKESEYWEFMQGISNNRF